MRFTSRFPWVTFRASQKIASQESAREPLREFVYLDEVSLASLLASQKGELTENITAQSVDESLVEVGTKVGVNAPLLPSAETTSRFQTSNSNSLQTVRKANAQSLFRELHKLQGLRKIQPVRGVPAAGSLSDLLADQYKHVVYKATDLERGDLVEFRVRLSASWIFQMSTMVAEFSDMFDDSPTLFIESVRFSDLYQARNANKIVSRLLAGLVPVDGMVPDYSVIELDGAEYIVSKDVVRELDLHSWPLKIVGVTEHLAYWKDIRRVLFAENEFTILCRISKSGLQRTWNPIKLADIFKEFSPDLANEIERSSRIAMTQTLKGQTQAPVEPGLTQLMLALVKYKDVILGGLKRKVSRKKLDEIEREMANLSVTAASAEAQRAAFAEVKAILEKVVKHDIDAESDFAARQEVRKSVGLALLPSASESPAALGTAEVESFEDDTSRLLDVEVVAIYW